MSIIKLLIVDNHPVIREGLIAMLSSYQDIDIAGICSDADEALEFINMAVPDVILMDIKLGKINGIEATRKILAKTTGIKVIMLTTYEDVESIRLSIQAGATGYMLKTVSKELLVEGIRRVYNGETIIDHSLINQIISDYLTLSNSYLIHLQNLAMSNHKGLTPRENEVLRHLAQGLTNGEISARTHLSVETVRTHLRNIYRKLGVMNRSQAISRIAEETPLVRSENVMV
ncbi:MAG: response regulator transcription factor [Firmicutes bacterium]|nr:response regulator transcription factor [Bacillota bacterium]